MFFQRIIDWYKDYKEIGEWGSYNTKTGQIEEGGKMYSQTVKVVNEDGSVSLQTQWLTDGDKEKNVESQ